jgi:hypothetical protein
MKSSLSRTCSIVLQRGKFSADETSLCPPSLQRSRPTAALVIFGQQEYVDLRITRSSDGGKSWSEPAKYGPTQKVNIYPGSLTTLSDGRILHVWNVWYADKEAQGGKSRFAQYSLSEDDGLTWSEPKSLAKPKTPGLTVFCVIRLSS